VGERGKFKSSDCVAWQYNYESHESTRMVPWAQKIRFARIRVMRSFRSFSATGNAQVRRNATAQRIQDWSNCMKNKVIIGPGAA